jgi:glycosyltransferase involved in cell wall biosynthesis
MKPLKWILPPLLNALKKKDLQAAKEVDYFVSNSDFIGKRIQKYYQRKSTTIYPCVDTAPFVRAFEKYAVEKSGYFLAVGRFIPYKKFDLLVRTFATNRLPLKLVGIGPEFERCQSLAQSLKADNIEFLGFVDHTDLPKLYAQARAFLFPAEEDFGLVPVEAMSAGTPVIYYARGGAVESVGEWGVGFTEQTVEGLQQGIDTFLEKEKTFDGVDLSKRGQNFDEKVFQREIVKFLELIV